MRKNKFKILMTGPNPDEPGGISTSVRCFLSLNPLSNYSIDHFLTGKPITEKDSLSRYIYRNISQFIYFFYTILSFRYYLVHIHTSSWGGFWRTSLYVIACKITSTPVILHIHGAEFKTFLLENGFFRRLIIKNILNSSSALIVLSTVWEKFFRGVVSSQRIYVLENLVKSPQFGTSYSKSQINFLFLGGLTKRKGLQELINVIPYFASKKYNVKFTIAGFTVPGESQLRKKIEILANDTKVSNVVNFLPDISEEKKVSLLLKSQVYILQSFDEGLPFSLLEAMSYGLAPITTPVGAIPEVVEDKVNGFIINAGDEVMLKNKIEELINDINLIERMGRSNIIKIKTEFGIDRLKSKIGKIYKLDN